MVLLSHSKMMNMVQHFVIYHQHHTALSNAESAKKCIVWSGFGQQGVYFLALAYIISLEMNLAFITCQKGCAMTHYTNVITRLI